MTLTADPSPDSGGGHPVVPDWLGQSASVGWRLLVVGAFGLVVLAGATVLGTVVASVVLAAAVTAAFDPLAERLRARGRSPSVVAGLVTLTVIGIAAAGIAVTVIAFVPAALDILRTIDTGVGRLETIAGLDGLPQPIANLATEIADGITGWVSSAASAIVGSIASTATIGLLAVFLVFFLVTDADRAIAWSIQAIAPRQRERIAAAAATARARLGGTLRETALRAVAIGAVAFVASLVLGLPAPLALAVLVVVGGFVPLLGLVTATAAVGLVALGSAGGLAAVVIVVVLAAATVLLPRVLGPSRWQGHGIHPAVVLVALTVGGVVAGGLGLILAVPVAIVLVEVLPAVVAALDQPVGDEQADGLVPYWLDRLAQWSWRLLVLVGIVAVAIGALLQVPLLIGPIIIAAVLAATLAPGFAALCRRGLAPTTASLAMTVGGFGLVLLVLGLTLASLAEPMAEIVANASIGAGLIDASAGSGETLASIVGVIGPQLLAAVGFVLAVVVVLVIGVALGAILTFYLLRDGVRGFKAATSRLVAWRREELGSAGARATGVLGGYMIATGAISAFGAATQFLIMFILGIPLAWPLAVLSFFGGFIPYIGSLLTTGLAFLVTVATGDTTAIFVMLIFTLVFNIVQGNIVAPLVYGRAVSIHPALVLLAIPAGAAVAGMAGMFLAVPVLGVISTTWRTVLRVFGSEPEDLVAEAPADPELEPGSGAVAAPGPGLAAAPGE